MTDNKNTLICPACGEFMEKVYLSEYGVNVDICLEGCGGIWFDNRELAKVDEKHENIGQIMDVIADKEFSPVDDTKVRWCPVCAEKLVKNYTGAKQKVQIDECYSCGGKFLDKHELDLMREEYLTDGHREAATRSLFMKKHGGDFAAAEFEANEALKNPSFMPDFFETILNKSKAAMLDGEDKQEILEKYDEFKNRQM